MMHITRPFMLCLLALSVLVMSCAARQPSEQRATRIVEKHFVRYARQYPVSPFGSNPVREVVVLQMQEIHKNEVVATVDLTRDDGEHSLAQCVIDRQWPRGWRLQAWERLDAQ